MAQMKRSSLRYRFHKHIIEKSWFQPTYSKLDFNEPRTDDVYFNKFHSRHFHMPVSVCEEGTAYLGLLAISALEFMIGMLFGFFAWCTINAGIMLAWHPRVTVDLFFSGSDNQANLFIVPGGIILIMVAALLTLNILGRVFREVFSWIAPSKDGFVKTWIKDKLDKTCTPIKYVD